MRRSTKVGLTSFNYLAGSVRNGNAHKEASQKASDKRKQFVQEIEQQSAELENTQQREYQVDKGWFPEELT